MTEQDQKQLGTILWVGIDQFRGATKMVIHGKGGELFPSAKESLTVQTRNAGEASVYATLDHFRGITKLIELGNDRRAAP